MLKKEKRKILLIKCKLEQGFTPSCLKSMVKSIVTSKPEWSGPGTLQDQSCASWGWWQVENGSEQSSWQWSSPAGAWAVSACETSHRQADKHRRAEGGPTRSAHHQGQITAFVHGPRWCPSAGAGTPDSVRRVVWRKPLAGYFNCVHVQQQNTTAEWPLLLEDTVVLLTSCSQWPSFSHLSLLHFFT